MTHLIVIPVCLAILILISVSTAARASGPAAIVRIQTDDTCAEFELADPSPVCIISRHGMPKERLSWGPEAILPSSAEIAGRFIPLRWKLQEHSFAQGQARFVYRCEHPDLQAESIWTARPGPGPVEHALSIRHLGDDIAVITPSPTISLAASREGRDPELWWVYKGAGWTLEEGGTQTERVGEGFTRILHSGPYSSDDATRDAIPWFCLHDPSVRRGLYGGIEFSGWSEISVKETAGEVRLAMGLQPREGKTKTRLAPGETLRFPTCFIGAYTGDVDDGCNRLHRWVEKYIRPPMPDGITPLLVNNSWGSGMAVDASLASRMIDDCAALGIELYHVDAGWYRDVGNWHAHPQKFPEGLEKIADYAHSKGLKFGLWVGWTQGGSARDAGPGVLSVFNPKQKDWFGQDYPDDWRNWEFTGMPVCLACREAQSWCLEELRRIVRQYKLDLLEHDQIMIVDACNRGGHGHIPGDPVDTSRAAAEGYYAVYDQLRKEHPHLLFEDCVNGGRLVDFGVARRNHYICVTDTYDPWTCRRAFYDASYPLPPSMIELYLANVPGESIASFRSMLRSAMLGWATIMIDTTQWSTEQHEAAKREFEVYKSRLRPLIASADLYHLLPRPNGKRWEAFQYHDRGREKGALYLFRAQAEEEKQTIRLRGLTPGRRYRIRSFDGSGPERLLGGRALMETGIEVRIPEKEGSDLLFVEAADEIPSKSDGR